MTTMDLDDGIHSNQRGGLFAGLRQALARHLETRRKRRAIIELSRLDARLLRDIGIEPMDIHDALNGKRGRSVLFNPVRRSDHE